MFYFLSLQKSELPSCAAKKAGTIMLRLEKTTFIDSVPGEFFLFFPSDWHIAKIATDKEDQDIRVIVIKLDYM